MSIVVKNVQESSKKEEDQLLLKLLQDETKGGFSLFGAEEYCLPTCFTEHYEKILNFQVRNDDVFVATFPKCGTTWSQEMIWLIGNTLNYKGAKKPLSDRFPFLELQGLIGKGEVASHFPKETTDTINITNNLPSPRYIKCHLPISLYPRQIQYREKNPKIIYTCRNPKDCLVSYYHHTKLFQPFNGTFDDFYKLFLAGRLEYAPYWKHVFGFWNRRHDKNVLFIHFEDMKRDLPSVIKKTADFLGKRYTEHEIKILAEHLSFDSMKRNPAVNYEELVNEMKKAGVNNAGGKFMRSGKVGDFKTHMTQNQIFQMDEWIREHIRGTDFKLKGA